VSNFENVAFVLKPSLLPSLAPKVSGYDARLMSTRPPEKSPGRFGVYDLMMAIESMKSAGKRLRGTTRLFGLVLGSRLPFSSADE
jgi:hypothetical protein